uniref:Transcription factor WRKY24 n=1 Tax=Lilium regale TaxID=82328 RepID=A0A894TQ48_LILRE|nr:transcription factor WRKY24 [Lilium regale]
MTGMGDRAGVFGDWNPNPSPRTFLSNFLNEDFGTRSFAHLLGECGNEAPEIESEDKKTLSSSMKEDGGAGLQLSGESSVKLSMVGTQKPSSRSSLAERIAERAGFNAPKLNTARIRTENLSSSHSEIMSPLLTIPPGLSPTSFLESPVFLFNSMAQPSPTTGKILFGQSNNAYSGSGLPDETKDRIFEDMPPEPFAFKPHPESRTFYFSNGENKSQDLSTINRQPPVPNTHAVVQPGHPVLSGNLDSTPINYQNQQTFSLQPGFSNSTERKDNTGDDITLNQRPSDSFTGKEQSPSLDDQADGEADPREFSSVATSAPAEDGYNWRKYGQKQVKGSEFPRSYYKCTHPNCQVKKKVERNHEGHVTEIIYKGGHSHPKPPPNRRSAVCHPFNDPQFDGSEHPGSQAISDGNQGWSDGLEQTLPASGTSEFCDKTSSMRAQNGARFESSDAIDVSSTQSNDEEDDRATHGSVSLGGEGEGDETESKRRKLDACTVEMSAASRAVREPRVVVQTTSEVDILDDGYRWRKYGQKVVKGNPNPRSYYKCTNPGCMVRKHVERASHDLKSVITTYEGKHNHDVPAARNSNHHSNSLASSATNTSVSQSRGLHGRQERLQDNLTPLAAFGLRGREHQMGPAGFGFGMPQHGLAGIGMGGMSSMVPMKMPSLPPAHFLRQDVDGRFLMPKGEPNEESSSESGLIMSRAAAVYHQMMSSASRASAVNKSR